MATPYKLWRLITGCILFLIVTACSQIGASATNDATTVAEVPVWQPTSSHSTLTTGEANLVTATAIPPRMIFSSPTRPVAATFTPFPTVTRTPTPTQTPSQTPTTPPTLTPTPLPSTTPAYQTCPETDPLKPAYFRGMPGEQRWPTPAADPQPHFWLSRPLPGSGRFLTSSVLPYGSDGTNRYLLHNGSDISQPRGALVVSAGEGRVVVARSDVDAWFGWRCNWYGNLVIVELDRQWNGKLIYVLYGHVQEVMAAAGDQVLPGSPLAEVGSEGVATLPHLHIEVRVGENSFWETRNPFLWFYPGDTRGLLIGRLVTSDGRAWQGIPVSVVGEESELGAWTAWTYLGDPVGMINPDEQYAENFVLGDLLPGTYQVSALVGDAIVTGEVEIRGGEISTLELVTD